MKNLLTFAASLALGTASLQLIPAFYPLPSETQISEPENAYAGHSPMAGYTVFPVKELSKSCFFGRNVALGNKHKEHGYYRCQPNGKWIRVGDFPESDYCLNASN